MRVPILRLALLAGLLLSAGCQAKLSMEGSYPLQQGEIRFHLIEAPISQQTIHVDVHSGGVPVNLYVLLGATKEEADKSLQDKTGILASKTTAADPALEATIPAKKPFAVMVESPDKPATIKIAITSR